MYENPDENRQIHAKCLPFFIYAWKITPFSWFREFAPTFGKLPLSSRTWVRASYAFWSGVEGGSKSSQLDYLQLAHFTSNETAKFLITGPLGQDPSVTLGFPSQRPNNEKSVYSAGLPSLIKTLNICWTTSYWIKWEYCIGLQSSLVVNIVWVVTHSSPMSITELVQTWFR